MKSLLLQINTATDSINTLVSEEKTLSIFDLITSGGTGGTIIMSILGCLSILAVYILFERFSAIKKASIEDQTFLKSIRNFVVAKDIQAARAEAKKGATALMKAQDILKANKAKYD